MRTLLVLSLFLVGCNQNMPAQSDPRDIHGVDSAFNSYVSQFESILGRSIGDIPIQFAPQGGNTIGICIVWNSQWREIKIDPDYWNADPNGGGPVDDDEKLSLIFHELGHCVLNRGHLDTSTVDINNNQILNSWMNWFVFFNDHYPQTKAYYINELFHPAPGAPSLGQSVGGPETDDEDFIHINTESNTNH